MIFGDPESVVSSTLKVNPEVTAIDTGSAVVRYAGGNQLLVSWSWGTRGKSLHDVIGPKGGLEFGPGPQGPPAGDEGKHAYFCITRTNGKQIQPAGAGGLQPDVQAPGAALPGLRPRPGRVPHPRDRGDQGGGRGRGDPQGGTRRRPADGPLVRGLSLGEGARDGEASRWRRAAAAGFVRLRGAAP